jgi:hypothetical protein
LNLTQLKTNVANRTGNDAIDNVLNEFVKQIEYDFSSRYPFSWRISLPVLVSTVTDLNYLNTSAYFPDYSDSWDAFELSTPQKLIYLPNWDINRLQPDQLRATGQRKGVPTHYNFDEANGRLWYYPYSDVPYSLSIRYLLASPEWVNASAHINLFVPKRHHHTIAAGVESLVWQLDEDLQSAQAANSRYETGIANAIEQEQQRSDFQPIMSPPSEFIDYSDPFLEI